MRMRQGARLALVLALATAACASPGPRKPGLGKEPGTAQAVVRVSNNNFADVTVYAMQGGMRWRLGTVTGLSEQRFRLPRRFALDASDLVLLADPVGGFQAYRSPGVRVQAGSQVALQVHPTLSMSTVSVWGP